MNIEASVISASKKKALIREIEHCSSTVGDFCVRRNLRSLLYTAIHESVKHDPPWTGQVMTRYGQIRVSKQAEDETVVYLVGTPHKVRMATGGRRW